jgi:hypothetical protein
MRDTIKELNQSFIRDKRRGKALISGKKKQTILLKKKQKEQEKDLKDGVLINNEVWIMARKEEIVKTKSEISDVVANTHYFESRYPMMIKAYNDLLREEWIILNALLRD